MLLYNKALDTNHTLLRIVSIILKLDVKVIEEDRIRIYDFIVTNPVHISTMPLGRDLVKNRNVFKCYENRYQKYDPIGLFRTMRPIQDAVFCSLKEMGVLKKQNHTDRYLVELGFIPEVLKDIALDKENSISSQAIDFICDHLVDLSLVGPKGLKCASMLMEYRYDAA